MIQRIIFVGGWAAVATALTLSVPCILLGIWLGSGKWGGTAALLIILGLVGSGALGLAWLDLEKPKPLPPRAVRKRLREERARIEFETRVAEMEKEAGL